MSRQSAELLASKGAYVDSGSWIEEFFCGDHGKLWMKVRKTGSIIVATLATSEDCHKQPAQFYQTPNPSVSEFTYRMSRQTGTKSFTAAENKTQFSERVRSITVTSAAPYFHLSLVFNPGGERVSCGCRRV